MQKDTFVKIAISGFSGCGNTTVSHLLAEKLGVPCINYTFHNLANDLNMPFEELVEKAKTDFSFDRTVDEKQIALTRNTSCVLGSRLAIWLLKDASLKVFLTAPLDIRSARIAGRENKTIAEVQAFTRMRDTQDTARYKTLYGIDNTDYKFADLIIDTSRYLPEKICAIILETLESSAR